MCEFISWIETADDKVYFLSDDQIKTKKGQDLKAWTECDNDLKGHGAIRRFYRLANHDGKDRECEDFSTPDNFPDEIAKAIKEGRMRGFGEYPKELLSAPAYKVYQETRDTAEKVYQETIAPAYKVYQETRDTAYKVYQETRDTVEKVYQETRDTVEKVYQETIAPAYKVYQETRDTAEKVYQETIAPAFWDLFANIGNRNPKWR